MFIEGRWFSFGCEQYTALLRLYVGERSSLDIQRLTQLRGECQRHWLGLTIKQRRELIKKIGYGRVGAPHDDTVWVGEAQTRVKLNIVNASIITIA